MLKDKKSQYVSQLKDLIFSNALKVMKWKLGKLNRDSFQCRESSLIFKILHTDRGQIVTRIGELWWHLPADFIESIGQRVFLLRKIRKNFRIHDFRRFHRAHRPSISYANSLKRWILFCLVSLVRPSARLYLLWKFKIVILKEILNNSNIIRKDIPYTVNWIVDANLE